MENREHPVAGSANRTASGMADTVETGPVLLYDGVCGFCDRTVQFVLNRDPGGAMRFATLQGAFAAGILDRFPELRSADSLVLVEHDAPGKVSRVLLRSDAALEIGIYLGGALGVLSRIGRLVPRFLRNAAYDVFARYRYRLFGRYDHCPLPPPLVRNRFID